MIRSPTVRVSKMTDRLKRKKMTPVGDDGCRRAAIAASCLAVLLVACKPYTVVKLNRDEGQNQGAVKVYFENDKFNADDYVTKIWDSKVLPYIEEKANEAPAVVSEYRKDADLAGEKYGTRSSSEGIPWNYVVKGRGKAIAVDTESMAGTVGVDLLPCDGKEDLRIQVGPVIKGTSIRDSLSFLSFDEFENQIEFAKLANTMNKRVHDLILSKIDFSKVQGKEVEFSGVFTADGTEDVLMTPVRLTVR